MDSEDADVGLGGIEEDAEAAEAVEEAVEAGSVLHEVGIRCSNKDMRTGQ